MKNVERERRDGGKRGMTELPDDIRRLIDAEVSSGLARRTAGDFGARMRAALKNDTIPVRRAPSMGWRSWVPAFGVVLAAVLVVIGLHRLDRGRAGERTDMAAVLESLPGFHSLDMASPDQLGLAVAPMANPSPFLRPLAAAATQSAGPGPAVKAPENVGPRYSLKQKIDILIEEQPIERALKSIKTNLGEA